MFGQFLAEWLTACEKLQSGVPVAVVIGILNPIDLRLHGGLCLDALGLRGTKLRTFVVCGLSFSGVGHCFLSWQGVVFLQLLWSSGVDSDYLLPLLLLHGFYPGVPPLTILASFAFSAGSSSGLASCLDNPWDAALLSSSMSASLTLAHLQSPGVVGAVDGTILLSRQLPTSEELITESQSPPSLGERPL